RSVLREGEAPAEPQPRASPQLAARLRGSVALPKLAQFETPDRPGRSIDAPVTADACWAFRHTAAHCLPPPCGADLHANPEPAGHPLGTAHRLSSAVRHRG